MSSFSSTIDVTLRGTRLQSRYMPIPSVILSQVRESATGLGTSPNYVTLVGIVGGEMEPMLIDSEMHLRPAPFKLTNERVVVCGWMSKLLLPVPPA